MSRFVKEVGRNFNQEPLTSGPGSGSVTSVALTAPTGFSVSGSPITSSGTLAITFASGYALPTTTKQGQWDSAYTNRITSLTTTGSSGAATLVSNVLNIPNYTLSGLGGVPTSRTITINGTTFDLSANRTFSVGTVTSVAALTIGTTGTDITSSVSNGTTTPVITLNIPTASATNRGALSSTDWLTFSSKQPAITLTTTGNNGSATLVGATLNIPTYTLVGLGGMSNPFSAALGQMIYSNSAGAPLSLAPNTTTTKKYLAMTGDGTNGAAPVWEAISGITGSGTTNYIAKFTSSSAVGNSLIYDTGTNIGINTATPTTISNYISLHIVGGPSGALIRFSDSTAANRGIIYGSTTETAINAVSQFNLYVDNNSTLNATSSGNVKIGGLSATAKFEVNNGSLATSGSGFMVSGGLTNGRLETYQSGTANCIHTWLDNNTYEISAGSTAGYVSGLVITGRSATLLPDRVAIYTRSTQRFQIGSTGQLQLNAYTSASSFTGTPTAYLACDSSGNIITSNPTSAGRNTRITFSAEVPNTWLSMPAAVTFFDNSTGFVTQADLTAYNQVRLIVNKQATAGAASSKIILRYQATSGSPFTASSYSDIGTSEVSVAINVANNILVSSWINMATAAKDDVWVTIVGIDGDGTISPQFGNIYAEFRFV